MTSSRPSSAHITSLYLAGGLGAVAALIGLIGVFLDWVSVATVLGSIGRKGIDTDDGKLALGIVLLALLAVFFAIAFRSRGWFALFGIAGTGALALAIYDGRDAAERAADVNAEAEGLGHASVGAGLWLLGIAGGIMLAVSYWGYTAATYCAHEAAIVSQDEGDAPGEDVASEDRPELPPPDLTRRR